jgi:ankyrin repeat protein
MVGPDAEILKIASKEGKTPLRKAAAKGHERIVQALYEKLGSDNSILNEQDAKYQTALHVAARNGRKNVVEYLLKNNAATNLKDKFGRTALAACLLSGWISTSSSDHQGVCTLLIDANINSAVGNGILQGAAMKGVLPILEKLLDQGADPNLPDEHGWTAIQTAKQYGKMDAVELLSSRNVSTALRPTRLRLSKRQDSVLIPQKGDRSGLKGMPVYSIQKIIDGILTRNTSHGLSGDLQPPDSWGCCWLLLRSTDWRYCRSP